ncbi:DUF11 domain-containing protein [Candidatus Saccharibacteria bacterium]|nr:DUF11 domain-containing protein [Candidatus Saccharibacteria bacterium]
MKNLKSVLGIAALTALAGTAVASSDVLAYGDSDGGRTMYTIDQINQGAIDDKIVLNSISDNPTVGSELYFVQARQDGTNDLWNANELTVEDGKTYVVRMYVHNNNPRGTEMVAKDVFANFNVPTESGKEIFVHGTLSSSNATPSKVWDDVVFKSSTGTFHLEYVKGSARIENNGKIDRTTLSDNLVMGGTTLGYDSLNGEIPGCFGYSAFVSFKVNVVYDYDFSIEKQVRVIGGEKTWAKQVYANVGDTVEYQIFYKNTSESQENDVQIIDMLGSNQTYIPGSTKLYTSENPNGIALESDGIVDKGINIGNYAPGAGAYIRFRVKMQNDNLGCGGDNVLRSWAQGYIGSNELMRQDYADVLIYQGCPEGPDPIIPDELPDTGPADIAMAVLGAGSLTTAAGYYIASRKRF